MSREGRFFFSSLGGVVPMGRPFRKKKVAKPSPYLIPYRKINYKGLNIIL